MSAQDSPADSSNPHEPIIDIEGIHSLLPPELLPAWLYTDDDSTWLSGGNPGSIDPQALLVSSTTATSTAAASAAGEIQPSYSLLLDQQPTAAVAAFDSEPRTKSMTHNVKWTQDEDALLLEGIQRHGFGNWTLISQTIVNRTASQCKNRGRHLKLVGRLPPECSQSTHKRGKKDDDDDVATNASEDAIIDVLGDFSLVPTSPATVAIASLSDMSVDSPVSGPLSPRNETHDLPIVQESEAEEQIETFIDPSILRSQSPSSQEKSNDFPTHTDDSIPIVNEWPPNLKTLPPNAITRFEIESLPEWFTHHLTNTDNTLAHPRARQAKTPQRYLRIRNHMLEQNKKCMARGEQLVKTKARRGLNEGDVNAIGRVFVWLQANGFVNNPNNGDNNAAGSVGFRDSSGSLFSSSSLSPAPMSPEVGGSGSKRKRQDTDDQSVVSQRPQRTRKSPLVPVVSIPVRNNRNSSSIAEGSIDKGKRKVGNDKKNPFELVSYRLEKPSDPLNVHVNHECLLIMDIHARLSRNEEIIGLLGGKLVPDLANPNRQHIHIQSVYPCIAQKPITDIRESLENETIILLDDESSNSNNNCKSSHNTSTECEMDPMDEVYAAEYFKERGMIIVGWYHSHPVFASVPSRRDLDTQAAYQRLFRTSLSNEQTDVKTEEAIFEPFVGVIVSPYIPNKANEMSSIQFMHLSPEEMKKKDMDAGASVRAYMPNVEYEKASTQEGLSEDAQKHLEKLFGGSYSVDDMISGDDGWKTFASAIEKWLPDDQGKTLEWIRAQVKR